MCVCFSSYLLTVDFLYVLDQYSSYYQSWIWKCQKIYIMTAQEWRHIWISHAKIVNVHWTLLALVFWDAIWTKSFHWEWNILATSIFTQAIMSLRGVVRLNLWLCIMSIAQGLGRGPTSKKNSQVFNPYRQIYVRKHTKTCFPFLSFLNNENTDLNTELPQGKQCHVLLI